MRLRHFAVVALASAALGAGAVARPAAADDGAASWVSAPAAPPPTPPGATPAPYPIAIGAITDIQFWSPDRGLLMTAGNATVPAGVWAYNGQDWHELSTVCGGADGKIAWAGPDDFWTISDERPYPLPAGQSTEVFQDRSLCHFQNGQVVASYAELINEPTSYQTLNAAACLSATDCWFGGEQVSAGGPSFHLQWDGTNLSVDEDSTYDHVAGSLATYDGALFEGVGVSAGDPLQPGDDGDPTQEPVLLRINPASPEPFGASGGLGCGSFCHLPGYEGDPDNDDASDPADPTTLGAPFLASDGSAAGVTPASSQLWVAGASDGADGGSGTQTAAPYLLVETRPAGATTPLLSQLSGVDYSGDGLDEQPLSNEPEASEMLAPEPGELVAWVLTEPNAGADGQAHVSRVAVQDGSAGIDQGPTETVTAGGALAGATIPTTSATVTEQDTLGIPQGVGPKGDASAIACPAPADCWLGTDKGWLFHYTDGTGYGVDTDPNFDGVISYRPPDAGIPPVQASGVLAATAVPPVRTYRPLRVRRTRKVKKLKPLVEEIGKAKLLKGTTTLVLPFKLSARARVQVVGTRHKLVVARSRSEILPAGSHTLMLKLNPKRYPTSLSLKAKAAPTAKTTTRRKKPTQKGPSTKKGPSTPGG